VRLAQPARIREDLREETPVPALASQAGPACVGAPVSDEEGPIVLEAHAPPAEPIAADVRVELEGTLRGRVRQALTCPYCHDAVAREGEVVECARDRCGALYHQECWEECSAGHGSCAVFGCCSTRAAPVSSLVYVLKVLRLVMAALLVPKRLAEIVEERENESLGSQIARLSSVAFPSLDPADHYGAQKMIAYLLASLFLAVTLVRVLPGMLPPGMEPLVPIFAPSLVLLGAFLLPAVVMVVSVTILCVTRALVLGLRGEIAALERGGITRKPSPAK
jgi:hypothetical protein